MKKVTLSLTAMLIITSIGYTDLLADEAERMCKKLEKKANKSDKKKGECVRNSGSYTEDGEFLSYPDCYHYWDNKVDEYMEVFDENNCY